MKLGLGILLTIFVTMLMFSTFVSAQVNVTYNITVNVTIGDISQITVTPNSLNWTDVIPGYEGGRINLTIRNTGSLNVSNIFAYLNTNETEPVRPYGIDNPANWSSGNMLVIQNNSAGTRWFWAQRKEWNQTAAIPNADYSGLTEGNAVAYGFLRNASREWVWAIGNSTNATGNGSICNNTDTEFAIEDDEDGGTTTTRTPTTTNITRNGGDFYYSYFSVDRPNGPIDDMCVAVSRTCDYILVYKYDMRGGWSTCANTDYLREEILNPGNSFYVTTDAWVPRGVPAGQLALATLTIEAS